MVPFRVSGFSSFDDEAAELGFMLRKLEKTSKELLLEHVIPYPDKVSLKVLPYVLEFYITFTLTSDSV